MTGKHRSCQPLASLAFAKLVLYSRHSPEIQSHAFPGIAKMNTYFWSLRRLTFATCLLFLFVAAVPGPNSTAQETKSPAPAKDKGAAAAPSPNQDAASPEVQRAVDKAIQDRLKDSKVVDIETSEKIASRLSEWAKLFGFFIGIPLALFAGILSFLGFRSYKDLVSKVDELRERVEENIKKIETETAAFAEKLQKANAQLEEAASLSAKFKELTQKVDRIENVVRFQGTRSLTPQIQDSLEKTLGEYCAYLKTVGLGIKPTIPTVVISDKDLNAFYQGGEKSKIFIHPELADCPDTALREFTHHVLQELKPKMSWSDDVAGIESGIADYLPASFLGDSDFGRDIWPVFERHTPGLKVPSRNLKNNDSFSLIRFEPSHQHRYGTVWGGAYWELREALRRETFDKLLLAAWKELDFERSRDDLTVMPHALLQQDKLLEAGKHGKKIRAVFKSRGLEL